MQPAPVPAGLLSGCVAGGSSSTSAAKPGVCPADKSMVQTTLYFGLSRPAEKTSPLKSGNSLSTVTSAALSRRADGV
ncbi:hypothetical protein LNP74_24785 [Klebsiella pneumoniae subsp. pneumoniae]|nr:hypothetical protein [Klebsiella pneumoniae subsp. pneumoniae]